MTFYYLRRIGSEMRIRRVDNVRVSSRVEIHCISTGISQSHEQFLAMLEHYRKTHSDRDYMEIPISCVRRVYGKLIDGVYDWKLPWPGDKT